jgi:hypothetical protein
MKNNGFKWVHVTFAIRREISPPVHINDVQLPQTDVKYPGLHLDKKTGDVSEGISKYQQLKKRIWT